METRSRIELAHRISPANQATIRGSGGADARGVGMTSRAEQIADDLAAANPKDTLIDSVRTPIVGRALPSAARGSYGRSNT